MNLSLSTGKLLAGLFALLLIDASILLLWLLISGISIESASHPHCTTAGVGNIVFPAVFVSVKGLVIMAGIALTFTVRALPANYNESRYIAVVTYQCAVFSTIYVVVYFATSLQPNQLSIFTSVLLGIGALINLLVFFLPKFQAMGVDMFHLSDTVLSSGIFALRRQNTNATASRRRKVSLHEGSAIGTSFIAAEKPSVFKDKERDKTPKMKADSTVNTEQPVCLAHTSACTTAMAAEQDHSNAGMVHGRERLSVSDAEHQSTLSSGTSSGFAANAAVVAAALSAIAARNSVTSRANTVTASASRGSQQQQPDGPTKPPARGSSTEQTDESWLDAMANIKRLYLKNASMVKSRQLEVNRTQKRLTEMNGGISELLDTLQAVALNIRLLCHKQHKYGKERAKKQQEMNKKAVSSTTTERNQPAQISSAVPLLRSAAEELEALIQLPIDALEIETDFVNYYVAPQYQRSLPLASRQALQFQRRIRSNSNPRMSQYSVAGGSAGGLAEAADGQRLRSSVMSPPVSPSAKAAVQPPPLPRLSPIGPTSVGAALNNVILQMRDDP